jgi:nucleoside-diphosphate-sugar epimerase/intein/homing endonuclease
MRVVVTGGAGFLGSHLCRALLDRGDEVVAVDNLVTGSMRNVDALAGQPGFSFLHHDVTTHVDVPGPVDAVMHLASPASPADFDRIPIEILLVGSAGTHNTLGLARAKGARHFLASTSEVYGDPHVHPQAETYWGNVNPIGPRSVYDEAKRFAEAMTMAYHRHHDVDVRIVRIFNSILADEQVLYDDGRELRREPIGDLARRLGKSSSDLSGYSVPAFDEAGTVAASPAIALIGHPSSGPCFRVRTRYGRTVRVTGDHSLFVRGAAGLPEARPVTELRVGDRIAISGRIQLPERDRLTVSLAEVWDAAGRDPWSLAVRAPRMGVLAYERRHELVAAFRTEVASKAADPARASWSRVKSCIDRHQLPLGAFRKLGMALPPNASVRLRTAGHAAELPETVLLTDELLWLLGLYVAEGCRYERDTKSAFISISCDEGTLDRAAKIIDRDLGLHVVRAPGSSARSGAIFVHSRLLLLLLDHLGFITGPKRIPGWVLGLPLSRLKWFIEGYREGDGVHSGAKFGGIRHEFSTTSEALKDDLLVALGRFGLVPSVGRYETTFKQATGPRKYPFWRLTMSHVNPWSPLDWDQGVRQRLQAERFGDLVWAPVTQIQEVPATPLVYDFCVPGRENFWAGGVACHNTYGPQMRPDDGRSVSNFLVQALAGKPLTVYGDGSQTRSFCYVEDEVRGFLALLDSDYVGPVNIGNPNEFTILQLAETVLEVTGSASEIQFHPLPVDDPTQRRPDIGLARELLGWEPVIDLRDGLVRTAEWFARG